MREHFDSGSLIIIEITFVCFVLALFLKGFTQALLIEIGVFLVSVKLILMAYKNSVANAQLAEELRAIRLLLEEKTTPR